MTTAPTRLLTSMPGVHRLLFGSSLMGLVLGCADRVTPSKSPSRPDSNVPATMANLARVPPMGFNDWNAFGCDVDEKLIQATADLFVSSGLKAAGYQYLNIDDCWSLHERASDGRLVADPAKFPSGIRGVAEYVHARGLKLGIYGDAGTKTCSGFPGSLGKEQLDADTWASWGVDYVKYDNCSNQSDGSRADYERRYTAMRRALENTGRPMVYSICEWGESKPWEWAEGVGHLWRTTGDIADNWASLKGIIARNAPLGEHAGPGHWNDPDMLEVGNGGMTATEYRTHLGLWAMMAAPLIIGTDLRKASAETLAILARRAVIAVDQDPLGKAARIVASEDGRMVLARDLANGDVALAFYNSTDTQQRIAASATAVGLPAAVAYRLEDLWTGDVTSSGPELGVGVPAHGAALYRARAAASNERLRPALSVDATLSPIIRDLPTGATLSVTLRNQSTTSVNAIDAELEAPPGWAIVARTPIVRTSLAPGFSATGVWEVRAAPNVAAGVYSLGVRASFPWPDRAAGGRTQLDVSATVITPPPAGTSHLSALGPVSAGSSGGPIERDAAAGGPGERDGSLLSVAGTVYTRGLGLRAPSEQKYYLGGACSWLTVAAGIDDESSVSGSASFKVLGDDRVLAESGPLRRGEPARPLRIELTAVKWLRLLTTPVAEDAGGAPSVDWAAPLLTCGQAAPAPTGERTLFSFESDAEPFSLRKASEGGRISPATSFHTDGAHGALLESPPDGNWFGASFEAPLDLSDKSSLAFDLSTQAAGTPGELAVEVGPDKTWCQGGHWAWTNPRSTRTIRSALKDLSCPKGATVDSRQIRGVWVFVKGGTFAIDQVRAE